VSKQRKQPHNGFICSDGDQGNMRINERFKSIVLNERIIHTSVRDHEEEVLFDREQISMATRDELEQTKTSKNLGLTMWETRKINE
jgi:hypothetical protein